MTTSPTNTSSPPFVHTSESLEYTAIHVFLPVQPPEKNDCSLENNNALARAACSAAQVYGTYVHESSEKFQWNRITKMLDSLQASVQFQQLDSGHVISQLRGMETSDVLIIFVTRQNAAIVLTKRESHMMCEAFEASPSRDAVEKTADALISSYPGSAVELSNELFHDESFLYHLAELLSRYDGLDSDLPLLSPAHPQYIKQLLDSVLQRIGHPTDVARVTDRVALLKRVRDHGWWFPADRGAWRRSPLWLLIRVATQMLVDRPSYKRFVLFFTCTLARDACNVNLPSDLLHLMSSQILRRLSKLGSSSPDWLSKMALETSTCLREILDARWKQLIIRRSPFRNPTQDELTRDTQMSLLDSREYIVNALANPVSKHIPAPFHPGDRPCGTIYDFLSSNGSFFDAAYDADPDATLYDVQRSVEEGIDDWFACVSNVDEACTQLEILMDKYMMKAYDSKISNPEDRSHMLLTGIELYVALDKLVVREIPMLADYPPEIPLSFLERLLLRKTTSLHRLSCAYQYLAARHAQSRPGWSVLSNDFTEDSFPVRYYNQSPYLQQLKARIDEDSTTRIFGHAGKQHGRAELTNTRHEYQEYQQSLPGGRQAEGRTSEFPLPPSPLREKVIAFELQCPACVRIWRSATPRILNNFNFFIFDEAYFNHKERLRHCNLLAGDPASRPYLVEWQGPPLHWQIHLANVVIYPNDSQNAAPTLRYVVQYPEWMSSMKEGFSVWQPANRSYTDEEISCNLKYYEGFSSSTIERYRYTSTSPNDILAAQADCPADLSLDEFIACAQLRSARSLQWLSILQGLRSRTLNLRHEDVHHFIAYSSLEVGPLDLSRGTWIQHQELQDPFFCSTLLDELESWVVDVGASSIDGVMSSISLLLTRVLASSPSHDISERTIVLLRRVRKKTFNWTLELSHDLMQASTNHERRGLLLAMASTCRSTFDVDSGVLEKLLHSAEDIDTFLSCTFFIAALQAGSGDHLNFYFRFPHDRGRHLSPALEDILRDVILADPSDYGIDLSVCKIYPNYHPDTCRWKQSQHPNIPWLTCNTGPTMWRPSGSLHINIRDGILRVDGQLLGGLPREVTDSPEWHEIFRDQGFFVIPSDLPEMNFTTFTITSKPKVHFSLQDGNLVLRVQCTRTNATLQLVPSRILQGDLPPALIDNHVHWLNLSAKIIEIRPRGQIWEVSAEHWKIDCASGRYHVYRDSDKGRETLVDIRSPTWAMISKCFSCLNDLDASKESWGGGLDDTSMQRLRRDLLITTLQLESVHFGSISAQLTVTLPRYCLSFFVNEREELASRDFRDMVYDENQSVEALFGLENILVLRPKTGILIPESLIHRRVIIPNGRPTMHGDYRVRITGRQVSDEPLYYIYTVDTELGCLVGDGSLTNTGFLANLHVATNCHRPDPLTGKTGAQAGLCLLRSARCRSIMKPKIANQDLFSSSTQYPQVNTAHRVIRSRLEYDRQLHFYGRMFVPEWHATRRAAYLFPFDVTGPSSKDQKHNFGSNHTSNLSVEPALPSLTRTVSALKCIFDVQITLDHLICNRAAPQLLARNVLVRETHYKAPEKIPELDQLFSSLRTDIPFQREYLTHLDASTQHVRMQSRMTHKVAGVNLLEILEEHYAQCRVKYLDSLNILKTCLGPTNDLEEQVLERYGQWPPITADVLLRYLATTSPIKVPPPWKKCLTYLALLLLDVQRARRLLQAALDGLEEELSKELENEGCDGWSAEEYPDWLLIQIQGNFLIRRPQVEVARELMSPSSGENTVMQVNMGEGKSSVIIPLTATVLAEGNQLVRIIVPKSMTVQMFGLLVSRLGGLTNRPIYHLPFSRTPEDNLQIFASPQIDDLIRFMSQCVTERGVVLLQPEHVASLKLMAVEEQIRAGKLMADPSTKNQNSIYTYMKAVLRLQALRGDTHVGSIFQSSNRSREENNPQADVHDGRSRNSHDAVDSASKWLFLQKWLHSNARDILDENDQILHTRFQLVYTVGSQQHIYGYPDRWTITQRVLKLVKKHLNSLSRYAPDAVEYEHGPPGSFPHVRILRASEVGPRLTSLITEDVMSGRLPGFSFDHISAALQNSIRSFISDEDILQIPDTERRVEEYAKRSNQSHLWNGLLLIRGLLTSNILLLALAERRWRVDYGLISHPTFGRFNRQNDTILAVPYRAKDVPLHSTQFGHPDLTIVLTCLCYYYAGLTEWQLRATFEIMLDKDDPSTEYAHWIEECGRELVPVSLQQLSDINLRSSEQYDNVIYPLFARNRATIDFYLSNVVFPKEAKEFPWKLTASSWDLAEAHEKHTTGFSGTNDERWLLPTSIAHHDLDYQKGTNARVLAHLLRPENDCYLVTHQNGEQWNTHTFLRTIVTQLPEIRVLLDVGSQILDLSNRQVATTWLSIARDTAGAIYFSDDDELMVLTRNGVVQPAHSSPLFQHLDRCIVYLDHEHTRGTDLKLPLGSRAAVTLGPKVTKDALVQGCMRMRKLGHGHSVMFFAPPEEDRNIRTVVAKTDPDARVTTIDILCWAIRETWTDIQRRAPYWAQQGMSHKSRSDAWLGFASGKITGKKLADAWLQPELKSLADLYAPCESSVSSLSALEPDIRQRCKDLGILSLPKAQMEEEQEREVFREQEREREVELPPKAEPAQHFLHPDVVLFVRTGVIPSPPFYSGSAFQPVFTTLEKSSATTAEADVWSPFILATADFCRTIQPESTRGTMDQYLRPVQWILSTKKNDQILVLLSPFEADRLMPDIRASEFVHLHLYAPRKSQRMKPADDLKFYSIPPLPSDWSPPWALIDQLNVFAGQLYLRDYQSYLRLCRFLDVPTKESPDDTTIRRNLFNIPGSFEEMEITFSGSPLPFVMALLAMRSRGVPFAHTHMGKILQGQILTEKDFER